MLRKIEFTKGNWERFFDYAYTQRFPFTPKFIQEESCISNGRNDIMNDGFDYTTIMTKEKYRAGTKIWVTCSFEQFGAPLITITDTLTKDEQGNLKYGVCKEIVLWENGLNVWDFFVDDGQLKWRKIFSSEFSVIPEVCHEICIEFAESNIRVIVGEKDYNLKINDLPNEFYVGITGCENINRFYNMKVLTMDEA